MRVTVCQIRGGWEQLEWVAGVLFYDIVGTFFFLPKNGFQNNGWQIIIDKNYF